jgi:membrane associated rhomboid family serine protease
MFIPLHDANSLKYIKHQYVTIALIVANVLVYMLTSLGSEYSAQVAAVGLGYIPSVAFDTAELPAEYESFPSN